MKEKKEIKQMRFPDGITIVFMIVVFVWLLSFVIPSGVYDRIPDEATGRNIVDATSFHFVEKEYLGIMDLLTAVHNGFVTGRQKAAGATFILIFLAMLFCVVALGMTELSQINAFFFLLCIVPGVVAGLSSKELVKAIVEGCRSVLYGALVVSVARGVSVILTDANVMDSVVYYLSSLVEGLPPVFGIVGMQLLQTIFNFFIPSGSRQAIVTLPILLPIADIMGLSHQATVFAFQYGDGLANIITPNSGILFASLGLAGITYNKWLKWFGKFFLFLNLLSFVTLMVAQLIHWGPF